MEILSLFANCRYICSEVDCIVNKAGVCYFREVIMEQGKEEHVQTKMIKRGDPHLEGMTKMCKCEET